MTTLPSVIPVFPLPNVVLFPQVMLPLHIFEPRYRQMVRDTRDKERPMIGMALLRGNWQDNYEGNPDVFPVGCAGEMVRVAPMPDGRYNILLQGFRRYRIQEEFFAKSYREAKVEWDEQTDDSLEANQREQLCNLLNRYLPKNENVQKFLADPTTEDAFFVNFFAFHLDFLPIEKQSLLEAESLRARVQQLCDILDFKLTETRWLEGGSGGKPRLH